MFDHSQVSQTTAETENATDANWSTASEPTRRMPSGENRRSTMRKTATVGTPIVSTHSMPVVHTDVPIVRIEERGR